VKAVGRKSWLYVTRHGSLSWLLKSCIWDGVCLYALMLGLDGYAAVPRVGLWPTTPP
jgi:hypothetical protein